MPATHPRSSCAAAPTFIHNARLDHSTNLTQNATSSCTKHYATRTRAAVSRIPRAYETPKNFRLTRVAPELSCNVNKLLAQKLRQTKKNKHACKHEQVFVLHTLKLHQPQMSSLHNHQHTLHILSKPHHSRSRLRICHAIATKMVRIPKSE